MRMLLGAAVHMVAGTLVQFCFHSLLPGVKFH